MGSKLCPKIILEGTRLTHKTDIAFALNEHPRIVGPRKYRYHSPLISAEWCTFTNVPWGRGPINFGPAEEVLAMETYGTWVRLFELQKYYSWIIDRFHISTKVFQYLVHRKEYDFGDIEKRLAALGFRHVLCSRTPESFGEARKSRLRVSGKPSQYDDLKQFVVEQDWFREFVRRSALLSLEVDVTDGDIARVTCEIADWLERTDGLYMPD